MGNNRFIRPLLAAALLMCALALMAQALARRTGVFDQLDLLVDVRHEIVSQYVEQPDETKMAESAVRAMVEALDDQYTVYLNPEELEPFDKQIRGTFSGIGAEVDLHDKQLRIVTPLDDSPAFKAGVMAGDVVLEIEGQSLLDLFAKLDSDGKRLAEAVKRLQGSEGTKVTIKVRHPSGEEALITITRGQINVVTVRSLRRGADGHWDFMLDPRRKIGYIRISQFTERTADDLRAALDQLLERQVKGLVLDLRFNPGGLLESAVKVADLFLPGGKRIVSVRGRAVPERVSTSTDPGTIPSIPMVVLANDASASASEVVTGALLDNERAQFVGTRTWGKGSVQQVRMLESGQGALKITNAYYYLPNGRNIHRRKDKDVWGVDPADGFWVPMTVEQTREMLKIRRQSDVLRDGNHNGDAAPVTPERVEQELADPQLAAGLRALLGYLDTSVWPRIGQSGVTELARQAKREGLERQRDALQERVRQVEAEIASLNGATTQPATQPTTEPGT